MRQSRWSLTSFFLLALLAIGSPRLAVAQDMPPILAPPAVAPGPSPVTEPAVAPKTMSVSPSAEAVVQPAKPVDEPHVVALHSAPVPHQEHAKFTELMKRLTTAHARTTHSAAAHEQAARSVNTTHRVASTTARHAMPASAPIRHVAVAYAYRAPEPAFPPGTAVPPPPGYFGPDPRERLVYGGPPLGAYGGWAGYRGRGPFYYP